MAFVPIVVPADLNNQMYPEVQNLITRNDGGNLATQAISIAIDEAKMYLSKYDLVQLFGDGVSNSATFTSPKLNQIIISIAIWNLLRLANPNVDMGVALEWYKQALDSLKGIQSGKAMPQGWPYLDTTGETAPTGDSIFSHSNPPRHNHF